MLCFMSRSAPDLSTNEYPNVSYKQKHQVSTRRRLDVDTMLYGRQQRCYNGETTSCDDCGNELRIYLKKRLITDSGPLRIHKERQVE